MESWSYTERKFMSKFVDEWMQKAMKGELALLSVYFYRLLHKFGDPNNAEEVVRRERKIIHQQALKILKNADVDPDERDDIDIMQLSTWYRMAGQAILDHAKLDQT